MSTIAAHASPSTTPATHFHPTGRHLNIGAGRIVWQDIVRIDVAIKKRQFHKNETILESFNHAKNGNGRLHLLGLVRILFLLCFSHHS